LKRGGAFHLVGSSPPNETINLFSEISVLCGEPEFRQSTFESKNLRTSGGENPFASSLVGNHKILERRGYRREVESVHALLQRNSNKHV